MLKLFRSIRHNLMETGKTSRYVKYAIGEIILVMIGILLALQVNNWNESRKLKTVEINVLKDIKSDLKDNIANLNKGIKLLKNSRPNALKIIELYKAKAPYNDSLLPYFYDFTAYWDPDFTYAGFENLKDFGVNLITNENLRRDIINLIEVEMEILDVADMRRINQLQSEMVVPLQKKYFHRDIRLEKEWVGYIPSDYDALMNDIEFYNVLTEIVFRQSRQILRYNTFNTKADKLIADIDNEIKQLK